MFNYLKKLFCWNNKTICNVCAKKINVGVKVVCGDYVVLKSKNGSNN